MFIHFLHYMPIWSVYSIFRHAHMEIGLNLSNYRNFRGDTSGQALECRPHHGRLLCDTDLSHIHIQEEEIHQTSEGEEEQINQQPVSYNLSGNGYQSATQIYVIDGYHLI